MNVAQLIETLEEFDPDADVLVYDLTYGVGIPLIAVNENKGSITIV